MLISIFDAEQRINKYHVEFAGHSTIPRLTNPRAFSELAKAMDYIKNTPSVISVDFQAILNDGTRTIITIGRAGDYMVEYIERPSVRTAQARQNVDILGR